MFYPFCVCIVLFLWFWVFLGGGQGDNPLDPVNGLGESTKCRGGEVGQCSKGELVCTVNTMLLEKRHFWSSLMTHPGQAPRLIEFINLFFLL